MLKVFGLGGFTLFSLKKESNYLFCKYYFMQGKRGVLE